MTRLFRKIGSDILHGRYLEHYITLVLIFLVLALDIFDLASNDILAEITLAVLALVIFTSLTTRDSLDRISLSLDKPFSADAFFGADRHSLETEFSQAKTIGIVGVTLSRTVRDYSSVLEERLKNGTQVRFILIDPDSTAPDQAVLRSRDVYSRQFYIDLLRPTLERISALSYASEEVELGLLPYKPAFGMFVIDPDDPRGRIIVEMYPHRSTELFPTFELTPSRDPYWYRIFRKQYDILWSSCESRIWHGAEVQNLVKDIRDKANQGM
jgi:hypothetical protein